MIQPNLPTSLSNSICCLRLRCGHNCPFQFFKLKKCPDLLHRYPIMSRLLILNFLSPMSHCLYEPTIFVLTFFWLNQSCIAKKPSGIFRPYQRPWDFWIDHQIPSSLDLNSNYFICVNSCSYFGSLYFIERCSMVDLL